jgi:hypothetical protein
MPTTRQYQFDVDTKRYLNRVNTHRSLNGLPDIQKSDAADIDNFVVGLKDLGIFNDVICWLFRSIHNIGSGVSVASLGGFISQDASLISGSATLPTWTNNGIQITATDQGINTNISQQRVFATRGLYSSMFFIDSTANEGRRIVTCDIPATGFGFGFDDFSTDNLRFINTGGGGNVPKNLFNPNFGFITTGKGEAPLGVKTFVNNTQYSNTTTNNPVTFPTSNIGVGGRHLVNISGVSAPENSKLQTNALLIAYKTHINLQTHQSLYSIIKSSIGKNLNLP